MLTKTFTAINDDKILAVISIAEQISYFISQCIPTTEVEVFSESTNTNALSKIFQISHANIKLNMRIKGSDSYSDSRSEPLLFIGIAHLNSSGDGVTYNLNTNYNTANKTLTYTLRYRRIPNGINLVDFNNLTYWYCEEINSFIASANGNWKFLVKCNNLIALNNSSGVYHFPSCSVSQSLPNECIMINDIKDNVILQNQFVYNCNPNIGAFNEVTFGGEKYLTLFKNVCVKL